MNRRSVAGLKFAVSAACASAAEPEAPKKDESLTALYEWLPADCPTMIFVRPPGGRLPKLGEVWEKDANAKQTSNSGALLHTQFAALYGLPIDAALTRFKLQRIKVVAAGAKDFRMVKSGPVGVYSCKGCLIFEFDESTTVEAQFPQATSAAQQIEMPERAERRL